MNLIINKSFLTDSVTDYKHSIDCKSISEIPSAGLTGDSSTMISSVGTDFLKK